MAKRLVSAFVGIVIGVTALVLDNLYVYLGLLSVFSAIGTWELIHATKCDKHKFLTCVSIAISFCFVWIRILPKFQECIQVVFLVYTLILLCTMLFAHKKITFADIATCGASSYVIPISLSCIISVRYIFHEYLPGVFMVVYLLFCAWLGDSGAYFVGTFFGKHKLCPNVSPKKTVEGFIGGILTVGIGVTVQCLVYNLLLPSEIKMNYAVLIPISMAAAVVGVLGDLSASVIKRQYDVKDFGNIMPGHGGVLDRFDSVLFVAPFLDVVLMNISPSL